MRKVLIVAYHFPPDAAVGALRPLKFAKYLPTYGCEPYILTVKEKYYQVLDNSRVGDNTALFEKVFRTRMFVHPSALYRRLKKAYCGPITEERTAPERIQPEAQDLLSAFRRLRRLADSLLSLPDEMLGWLPIGTAKAIQLLRRYTIGCIYTSGPPHSVHLMGLVIKKITGVRWVADFRDPWAFCWGNIRTPAARIDAWLERRVVEHADAVVTTTERMTEAFRRAYSAVVPPGRFVTIWNGYDGEDFGTLDRHKTGKFTIMYLGSFYDARTPEPLLMAISELIAEGKIEAPRLEVQFVGTCEYANGRRVSDLVASLRLSSVVTVMAPVSYKEALARMVGCDLLLLLAPDQASMIPAKAFEYLASGSDVLAVTGDGATADLMRRFERGMVVHPQDIEGMKEAVLQCYARRRDGRSDGRGVLAQDVQMYERRELTKELVSVLKGIDHS